MKSLRLSVFLGVIFFAFASATAFSQAAKNFGKPLDLDEIEDLYKSEKIRITKPFEDLRVRYIAALKKTGDDLQTLGNLDGILESKQSIADAENGALPDGKSEQPALAKVEQVYLKSRIDLEKSLDAPLRKAAADHIAMLEELATKLTKASKIDEALQVRDKLIEAKKMRSLSEIPAMVITTEKDPVRIISAIYGADEKKADVTAKVRELVENRRVDFTINPNTLGTDPYPDHGKTCAIKYVKDGTLHNQLRGENETLLIESFYGPQTKAEQEKWLAGSQWYNDQPLTFNADHTFSVKGGIEVNHWDIPDYWKLHLTWANGTESVCAFDWRWVTFHEHGGENRIFKKLK